MPTDGRASRWGSPDGAAARACSRDRLAKRQSNPSRALRGALSPDRGGGAAPFHRFGTAASVRAPTGLRSRRLAHAFRTAACFTTACFETHGHGDRFWSPGPMSSALRRKPRAAGREHPADRPAAPSFLLGNGMRLCVGGVLFSSQKTSLVPAPTDSAVVPRLDTRLPGPAPGATGFWKDGRARQGATVPDSGQGVPGAFGPA